MTILNNQPARSGNMIDSGGNLENIVDILSENSSATPVAYNQEAAQNILNRSTPLSGNMVGSDGTVYNIVDLLKGISTGSDVLKYKGSVATYDELPDDAEVGDVYNVLDTGKNYAWTGTDWDDFGGAVTIALAACTDVTITTPTNGQVLVYNSSTQKWENDTVSTSTSLSTLTDVALSTPTDGQTLVYNSVSQKWENGSVAGGASYDAGTKTITL